MFSQLRTRTGKVLLWLVAIALLGFMATLFPEVRRHLPWFQDEATTPAGEAGPG